jgi:hypothetical protein
MLVDLEDLNFKNQKIKLMLIQILIFLKRATI